MTKDNVLLTTIVVAVFGVIAAYFACNFLLGDIESVSFNTVDANVNSALVEPDPEVFNYRALNPTVEVYVGQCQSYDVYGNCLDKVDNQETQ